MKRFFVVLIALAIIAVPMVFANGTQEPADSAKPGAAAVEKLDKWPTSSVTIVITYKPGGSTGRHASAIAPYLSKELGVPVNVEYREGGDTTVGYLTHIRSDPEDGSYIIYGNLNAYCQNAVRGVYKYEDVVSLGMLVVGHRILAVNPQFNRFADFKDFLAKVKANPDKYSTPASKGWGAVIERVFTENGFKFRTVPYSGSDERLAFYAGDVDFYLTDFENVASGGDASTYKPVAIFAKGSSYKIPMANDIVKEMGYKFEFPNMISPRNFQVKASFKQKYPARFDMLARAIKAAALNPDFQADMKKMGDAFAFNPVLPQDSDAILDAYYGDLLKYKELF